jgi:hypothetical protein
MLSRRVAPSVAAAARTGRCNHNGSGFRSITATGSRSAAADLRRCLPACQPSPRSFGSASSGGGGSPGASGCGHSDDRSARPANGLVCGINEVMQAQPLTCIAYVMSCRYVVFFPVVYCVRHFELAVPTELALAYVLTRPLVKLRFPIELGVATLLAWAFPALTKVKVSALLGLLPTASQSAAARRRLPFYSVAGYLGACYPSRATVDPVSAAMARLAAPADRYGAAFYVRAVSTKCHF